MGWGFDCLCWPWGRAFGRSCSPRGGDINLNLSSPDVEVFDCRLGRKRLRQNVRFPLSRFTQPPYGLKRSGSHGGKWAKQAKAEWISLFCLQISFVLACFWSIEPLKIRLYCGIKVNGSKDKPSRFLQVQLTSVWLIRYNHCKLIKLTFIVPFTKNGIFKVTKCGLSLKVYVFYVV